LLTKRADRSNSCRRIGQMGVALTTVFTLTPPRAADLSRRGERVRTIVNYSHAPAQENYPYRINLTGDGRIADFSCELLCELARHG